MRRDRGALSHRGGSPLAELGVRIERVMTDRAKCYIDSRAFHEAREQLGIAHRPTRGYRPQTNGKAERYIRTLIGEWAYARLYRSNTERLRALPGWVHFYNHHRAHTALGGKTPDGCPRQQGPWELHLGGSFGGGRILAGPARRWPAA